MFSKGINLLVAANNSGKTTILRTLFSLQDHEGRNGFYKPSRAGGEDLVIEMEMANAQGRLHEIIEKSQIKKVSGNPLNPVLVPPVGDQPTAIIRITRDKATISDMNGRLMDYQFRFPKIEPQNWIYPFLSRRKHAAYSQTVTSEHSAIVDESVDNLYAKIDRITGDFAANEFIEACSRILNFQVRCIQSKGGKRAGLLIDRTSLIEVGSMGEGTRNILPLILDLCVADGHLFLLEEPENDIHPRALKELLKLILRKAVNNQFVISTHSNIVVKHLASDPTTKLFSISTSLANNIPTSVVKAVENSPQSRLSLLEDLGYEVFDFDLFKGYLLLEESTAERVINELLIPECAPNLINSLKTISCSGISKVEARFEDFLRLFVFVHTTSMYHGKAWVVVDSGEEGNKIISGLKDKFVTNAQMPDEKRWDQSHFQKLSKTAFELYYPDPFHRRAQEVIAISDYKEQMKAKGKLAIDVIHWAKSTPENLAVAKQAFQEPIRILSEIEAKLVPS